LHYCGSIPIILVGLKKDLRYDKEVIEDLKKTKQHPVTTKEVMSRFDHIKQSINRFGRERKLLGRSVPQSTLSAQLSQEKDSTKCMSGLRELF
jgi:Ras family protein A